jgi:hypothetical protein
MKAWTKEASMLEALTTEDPSAPTPAPEFRRMEPFIGTWLLEGDQLETEIGPACTVEALETFEWLTGGHFVVHRFEGRVGDEPAACIEVIGYDAARGEHPARTFYNDGRTSDWRLRETGETWTLTGEWDGASGPVTVRCTTAFAEGGGMRTSRWEYAKPGGEWTLFWDVRATKSG